EVARPRVPRRRGVVRPAPAGAPRTARRRSARQEVTPAMPSIPPEVEPAFEVVLRALGMIPGFALIPVEVTGPDLGRALASWLGARGEPTRVVEPLDEPAWRGLVASVLDGEGESDG